MPIVGSVSQSVTAWNSTELTELKSGSADILVLERANLPNMVEAVRLAPIAEYRAQVTLRNAATKIELGVSELKLANSGFADDVTSLVRSFVTEFDRSSVSLRIEIVNTQSCPKFHCDNVYIRLVTTYVGPCTEYQYAEESEVRVAGLGSLVFLKGHKHPTHRDSVYHRSPAVPPGTKRLCVVIDF
ncbi:MAG: DUF1826 domain-containing protein [Pirellulaceae bacterium]|nr:DUF1826 domain-containing protein [Pirellulaceae bacterium]